MVKFTTSVIVDLLWNKNIHREKPMAWPQSWNIPTDQTKFEKTEDRPWQTHLLLRKSTFNNAKDSILFSASQVCYFFLLDNEVTALHSYQVIIRQMRGNNAMDLSINMSSMRTSLINVSCYGLLCTLPSHSSGYSSLGSESAARAPHRTIFSLTLRRIDEVGS